MKNNIRPSYIALELTNETCADANFIWKINMTRNVGGVKSSRSKSITTPQNVEVNGSNYSDGCHANHRVRQAISAVHNPTCEVLQDMSFPNESRAINGEHLVESTNSVAWYVRQRWRACIMRDRVRGEGYGVNQRKCDVSGKWVDRRNYARRMWEGMGPGRGSGGGWPGGTVVNVGNTHER